MVEVEEDEERPEPGSTSARRLRILVGALPLQFAFGVVYSWGAVAPFVERQERWPAVLIAAVFSATPVGYGTGIVVGGRLADRLPPRRLCWTGAGLLAIAMAVALSFPSGATFIVLYSMLGLGFGGGIALAGSVAAARHAIPNRPGGAGGLVTGAYAVAAPVQVPIVSSLSQLYGWLPALRLMGTAMLGLGALTLAFMPPVPRPRHHVEAGHPPALNVARRARVWTGFLVEACATPLGAYAFVAAATYTRSIGLAAAVATAAITAVAVGNAGGRVIGGAASDRLGVDRVMLMVLLLDLAAGITLFLTSIPALAVAASLLAGIGFGAPAGVIGRIAQDAAPDAPNTAFGLVFTGFGLGAGSGSLLGAAVGGRDAWPVLATLPLLGLAVVWVRLRLQTRVPVLSKHSKNGD
jgi:predicted MFS family arabinose efflux permease